MLGWAERVKNGFWCCRDLLYQEKENLFKDLSRGTSEVRDLLEKEKEDIR